MLEEASLQFRLRKIDETRNENFSFNRYWLYFIFYICLIHLCSCWYYNFCNMNKICAITAGIKTYKSIIKKRKEKHDKTVLLGKYKLNTIEVLISKALIDSYISHNEFVSVNHVLREYNEIKTFV